MKNASTSIIILAAGNSSRLGVPKQLLESGNKSYLRIIAEKALDARLLEVIGVLGFESSRMQREFEGLNVRTVVNHHWETGIASSVRAGIDAVAPEAEAALITLCDQPAVTSELLNRLTTSCSCEKPIAATKYNEIHGVPACFHRSIFPELLLLQGDIGAKQIIARNTDRVIACFFPGAANDIDTQEDLRNHRLQRE